MNDSSIAVRYAKALFLAAKEQQSTEAVLNDLNYLEVLLIEADSFKDLVESPVIQVSKKNELINQILKDRVADLSYRFIELLVTNRREGYLAAIIRKFQHLYRIDQGIVKATLTTVGKADADTMAEVERFLQEQYQAKVELEEKQNEDLIGGFVLRIEDEQYDSSIASQLKRIKRELEQAIIN